MSWWVVPLSCLTKITQPRSSHATADENKRNTFVTMAGHEQAQRITAGPSAHQTADSACFSINNDPYVKHSYY